MKQSKQYKEKNKLIDKTRCYSPKEAVELLKEVSYSSYNESVELHFNLGIDPKHADQQLRGTVSLPNGIGKEKKVLVIAEGEDAKLATDNGADYVGSDDYIEKIQGGWFEFDIVISTPPLMKKIGRLGKVLGAKGLMPNPKLGTVTKDIAKAVKEFKSGKFEYRNDKNGIIHLIIGNTSFTANDLLTNFNYIYDFIHKIKPNKAKGTYFKSIALCSTQSPSIFIEPIKIKWDTK
ncbi:50S ribosomal protein L1 [Candidatus Marinamargulisbacteria bacterium SCGC AG-333-B06]|nr:50S ribosomal protein L1 [Candidatus Marinamargulisbacteria bacterium SCGC AG-333-B06]